MVPLPVKFKLPPWTRKTCSSAVMVWLFKLILTVLLISKVLVNATSLVKVIVSVLFAAKMASSKLSKYRSPILALTESLAWTFINGIIRVRNIRHEKNIFLIMIPPSVSLNFIRIIFI